MTPPEAVAPEDELLAAVWHATGLDFRGYARSTLRRRVADVGAALGVPDAAALAARVGRDGAAMDVLVRALFVQVTAMFRDPEFWRRFRGCALPVLRTAGPVRAWDAGCATGEEAWSLAIVLHEEGLLRAARLLATDLDATALEHARAGILPLDRMREYTVNYQRAGGAAEFSAYYRADAGGATVVPALRAAVSWARGDVAAPVAPAEPYDVVLCRNVIMYFGPDLQRRAHAALLAALRPGGVLALGHGEEPHAAVGDRYEVLDDRERIFRRVR